MTYTLITGALSDIGKEICRTLEKSGHHLLMVDISFEYLESFRNTLINNDLHLSLELDLSDIEQSKAKLTSFIIERNVGISCVVLAAGIFGLKPLKLVDYTFLKKVFDVSLFSVFAISQILFSKKINSDNLKSMVIISSVSAIIGSKGYSVYGAVKASLLGLMKSLSVEFAPKVRVNAVLPGAIRTKTTNFIFESQEELNSRYLLGEGQCLDIANMIEFLLSEKSRWITGQEFIVDGGLIAN